MKNWKYFVPATLWVIMIFILCTLPGKDIPTNSFLEKIHFDKFVHFGLFGGIVFFFSLAIHWKKQYVSAVTLLLFVVLSAAYGLAIEFIQKYWAIGRSFDLYDALADTLGAIAGVWVFKLFQKYFLSRKAK